MTTWFNDLKELIWHPKSKGFDQIAEHGTVKKGLLTYFGLEVVFCLLVATLVLPLVGFLMPGYIRELDALGSAIIIGLAIVFFLFQAVSILFNSAIFYGLYKLTSGEATWTDVVKGFIYGKVITNVYGIVLGLILLSFSAGIFVVSSYSMVPVLFFVGGGFAVAIWIFYMNLSLMARIINSSLMKAFLLLLATGIVQLILEYMLKIYKFYT